MKSNLPVYISQKHCKTAILLFWIVLLTVSLLSMAYAESAPILSFSETSISVVKGRSVKVQPLIENVQNPKKVKYTWESSDPSVATVNNGTIQGKKGGSAEISCTAVLEDQSTLTAKISVKVTIPVSSVSITNNPDTTFIVGKEYTMRAKVIPEDATDKTVLWSVQDQYVAWISSDGVLSIRNPGKTVITATSADGSKRSKNYTVYVPSMTAKSHDVYVNSTNGTEYRIPFYGDSTYYRNNITIKGTNKHSSYTAKYSKDTDEIIFQISPQSGGDDTITITDQKDSKSKATLNVRVTSNAIAPEIGIVITDVNMRQNKYDLSFQISFKNNTQDTVSSVTLLVDYYGLDGNQHYCYSIENRNEQAEYQFTTATNLAPGQVSKFSYNNYVFTSSSYPIGSIRAAISEYGFKNGKSVTIPDSQLHWFKYGSGYIYKPVSDKPYSPPSSAIMNKANSFMIGLTNYQLYSFISKKFAQSDYPGFLISVVNRGSLAEKVGLYEHDVIYGADDMLWADEPHFMDIAKAKMEDGETVTLHIIRNGMKKDILISKAMLLEDAPTVAPSPEPVPTIEPVKKDSSEENSIQTKEMNEVLEITETNNKLENGIQNIQIVCKNTTDTIIHDVKLTICFLDETGTVIQTLDASSNVLLRPGKPVTLTVQMESSIQTVSFYVDQINYTDLDGNEHTLFIQDIQEYPLQ